MSPASPCEELRAAAAILRRCAANATPGPWEIEYDYHGEQPQALFVMDPDCPDDPDFSIGIGGMVRPADNAWVALMGPDKAELIARILDQSAGLAEMLAERGDPDPLTGRSPAFAFALAILAATPRQEGQTNG